MGYVIAVATPVYFDTMNAQMKILIDRTVPKYTWISSDDFFYCERLEQPQEFDGTDD
jgi:hypothetical protein